MLLQTVFFALRRLPDAAAFEILGNGSASPPLNTVYACLRAGLRVEDFNLRLINYVRVLKIYAKFTFATLCFMNLLQQSFTRFDCPRKIHITAISRRFGVNFLVGGRKGHCFCIGFAF